MAQFDFLKYKQILKQYGYELVNRNGTVFIRRRPRTVDQPTPRQQVARDALTLASSSQRGSKGFDEAGMPVVASKNRILIHDSLIFLRATTEEKRVQLARQVADEVGLEPVEKAELVALVRGKGFSG
jgi:hypothetical protein